MAPVALPKYGRDPRVRHPRTSTGRLACDASVAGPMRLRPRRRRWQPLHLDPIPEVEAAHGSAGRAGHAPGHLGEEVAAAEELEPAQACLVAHAGEQQRAAPAEDPPVGSLPPEGPGLAVGLEGAEHDDRPRPPSARIAGRAPEMSLKSRRASASQDCDQYASAPNCT